MANNEEERRAGLTFGGNLRAAVFGVSDGLVSNTSLIMGVSGAFADPRTVLITGAAGVLAGALSMAAGEYVSMRSQRELFEEQIAREEEALKTHPKEEIDALARIYHRRGLPLDVARRISKALSADERAALETHAREHLGLNPEDLGSPVGAGISSFVSFGLGATVPLLPFILGAAGHAFLLAIVLAAIGLFVVGVASSWVTSQARLRGGVRLLVFGGGAGIVAYLIGKLLGVSV
ncbi:MAG TPA: VIT1/CCC1 transporter family protein [Burkholderiales bacterium]|nr:VIT1/CCC1 transporter family protein [Burkholderiales bacterium]